MPVTMTTWTERDHDALRRLLEQPSLAREFDSLQGIGLDQMVRDPYCHPGTRLMLLDADRPVAFAYAFLVPGATQGPWAFMRIAVAEEHRRRDLGSELLRELDRRIDSLHPGCVETCLSAWEPCPETEAFAIAHRYAYARTYWLMEFAGDSAPGPQWPAGHEIRSFDGSDATIGDYTDTYNRSFFDHYHFVPATTHTVRALCDRPGFRGDDIVLVYDAARCVAFCRCDRRNERGEVSLVGVVPEARGRGLGRGVLRWGTRRLADAHAAPITLMVDGQNENALRLYRSEGYRVSRTRRSWSRMR